MYLISVCRYQLNVWKTKRKNKSWFSEQLLKQTITVFQNIFQEKKIYFLKNKYIDYVLTHSTFSVFSKKVFQFYKLNHLRMHNFTCIKIFTIWKSSLLFFNHTFSKNAFTKFIVIHLKAFCFYIQTWNETVIH